MPDAPPPSQRLRRHQRVTRSDDFRAVFDQGRKQVGKYMVLWYREQADQPLRLGVVASRKVGPSVDRSKARRRLREVFRRHRELCAGGGDVLLISRRAILGAPWKEVCSEFLSLAERAGLGRR